MNINRLETFFGETGIHDGECELKPFGGRYRFDNRTWSIVVWAQDWNSARQYAYQHNMTIDGQIIQEIEN